MSRRPKSHKNGWRNRTTKRGGVPNIRLQTSSSNTTSQWMTVPQWTDIPPSVVFSCPIPHPTIVGQTTAHPSRCKSSRPIHTCLLQENAFPLRPRWLGRNRHDTALRSGRLLSCRHPYPAHPTLKTLETAYHSIRPRLVVAGRPSTS